MLDNIIIRRGLVFSLFSAFNTCIGFVIAMYLSQVLDPNNFGLINLQMTYGLIFSTIISLGTESYLSVNFYQFKTDYLSSIVFTILYISLIVFTIIFSLLLVVYMFCGDRLFSPTLFVSAVANSAMSVVQNLALEVLRLNEKTQKYGLFVLSAGLLNVSLTVIFIYSYQRTYQARIISQLAAGLIMAIASLIILSRSGYLRMRLMPWSNVKIMLKYGLPLVPHSSTVWLRTGLDRLYISHYLGSSSLGLYSFAYNLAGLLLMAGTAMNSVYSAGVFKNLSQGGSKGEKNLLQEIYRLGVLFLILLVLGLTLGHLIVLNFFNQYSESRSLLLPLFVSAFAQCIYYLFVNYLLFYKKTKLLVSITFGVSVIHALISNLLSRFSLQHVACFQMLSSCIILFLVIRTSLKYINLSAQIK